MNMLKDYEKLVDDLDKPFVWSRVENDFNDLYSSKQLKPEVKKR